MRRLCNLTKPLSEFHVNNSNADKHDTRCKTCCQGYEKEKRAKKRRILEPTVAEKTCRPVLPSSHPAALNMTDAQAGCGGS